MNQDYIPGEECQCSAYNESECGCGADWTPREVYELRDKAERYRLEANSLMMQRDRLAEACKLLMRVIGDPNASAEDWWATEDEVNAAWNSGSEALAAVKGGSDDN
jgi:hypothetical protein